MQEPARFLITAALPYANGPLHIGHIAGAYLPADIYVRYLKSKGKDVAFICGSDEHGAAITIKALKEKSTPQEIVDKYHAQIEKSFHDFGIKFDIYHRTSSPIHHQTAQDFFKVLHDKNKFITETSEQYYDEEFNQFLADRYIIGTCPKCNNENAYGDQCEKCGSSLNPRDLKNPKSSLSGNKPILKSTQHWFFPLNDYEKWLQEWILVDHKTDWKTNVYGQCKSWLDAGLQPRAMTRDLDWGVKVPLPDAEGKVLYVWLDAPIGYISATKQWASDHGKNWEDYWKKSDTKLVHFIGKDNIVFHCIIFPSLLKAHGDYILPDNVPANEFLNLEGDKISTSRNHAVWVHEYLEEFPHKQDTLRYVLCSIAPESKDSEFTWADFQARNNNELAAILGNFINRTIVLTEKYFESKLPPLGELKERENQLIKEIKSLTKNIEENIEQYRFRDAQAAFMNIARVGNKYLADTEPWKLIKTNPEEVATILHISLYIMANLAILGEPFLPFTSRKIKKALGLPATLTWDQANDLSILSKITNITNPGLIFEKIEDEAIGIQLKKLEKPFMAKIEEKIIPQKEAITFDDFTKLDLRIGIIVEAEKVPKTDKLLKLILEVGSEKRTVVSGIAEHYKPEDIIGQHVCVLLNLLPRKMKGIESQGMILMAEHNGKLCFMQPSEKIAPGSVIS